MGDQVQQLEATYTDLVNRCGKLRMLSHRIALFASLAEGAPDDERDAVGERLSEALAMFNELYESVKSRRLGFDKPEVDAPTFRVLLEGGGAEMVDSFRNRAAGLQRTIEKHEKIGHAHLLDFVDFVAGPLLQKLSQLTEAFSNDLHAEAKQKHKEMSKTLRDIRSMTQDVHFISLNASIASARAGEAGAVFGAIAKEIGTLASESGASAERLSKLIGN